MAKKCGTIPLIAQSKDCAQKAISKSCGATAIFFAFERGVGNMTLKYRAICITKELQIIEEHFFETMKEAKKFASENAYKFFAINILRDG